MCSSFLRRLAAAFCVAVAADGSAEARELRVCADPNNLPFSNLAGEGFENRIAELLARDLGATLSYDWHAQRRGFLRETLKNGRCDVVAGLPANMEGVRTTRPYYRSAYAFVTRRGEPRPESLNDPLLRGVTIGVQLVGDDGWNTPPAHALARRGITENVRGYTLYGDYRNPTPTAGIMDAVARGEVEVAVVWGPLAGYLAPREGVPLEVTLVAPLFDGPQLPMAWDISMAVRKTDTARWKELDAALLRLAPRIDAVLATYGVPRLDRPVASAQTQP